MRAPQATVDREVQGDLYLRQVRRQLLECRPIVEAFDKHERKAEARRKKSEAAKAKKLRKAQAATVQAVSRGQRRQEAAAKKKATAKRAPVKGKGKRRAVSSDLEDDDDDAEVEEDKDNVGSRSGIDKLAEGEDNEEEPEVRIVKRWKSSVAGSGGPVKRQRFEDDDEKADSGPQTGKLGEVSACVLYL